MVNQLRIAMRQVRVTIRLLLIGYAILALAVVGGFFQVERLVDENRQRITDIQDARIASCKQTYEGIREVFMPLFPARPNPTQQKNLTTFNTTINDLKAGCKRQIQTKKEEP